MEKLSDQLTQLADRTKQVEDTATAAKAKNRAQLETTKTSLKASLDAVGTKADEAKTRAQGWMGDVHDSVEKHFADRRAAGAEHKAERDLKRAERRADDAEQDAADAVALVLYALDQAEYAIVDAVLARADADDLAADPGA
jgi:DNA repair exonuclease SbcCD ATPase subunit